MSVRLVLDVRNKDKVNSELYHSGFSNERRWGFGTGALSRNK